jgi:hypothetical protein
MRNVPQYISSNERCVSERIWVLEHDDRFLELEKDGLDKLKQFAISLYSAIMKYIRLLNMAVIE